MIRCSGCSPTPSQKATVKYFFVVAALWVVQVALGAIVAHYGVEGGGFYGIPLAKWLPYSVARTWHLQIGIFWIATSWLATGLYIVPAVSGVEPKGQRLGVNALFVAVVAVVVGSLAGEWLGIQQKLGNLWFWFGAQGYEYVDLGRALADPAFRRPHFLAMADVARTEARAGAPRREPLALDAVSDFQYRHPAVLRGRPDVRPAQPTHYRRVLALVGGASLGGRVLRSFRNRGHRLPAHPSEAAFDIDCHARRLVLDRHYLSGGIIGTFHHLYFTGTPDVVLALGAVFSAFEVVPLVLIGFEAWENIRLSRGTADNPWISAYKWPIYFFVAVAFWNFVGAGLFGFMINPPVALYYVQGLNLTPVHGHTALFGVYGMLGLGLMLFCLRALRPGLMWKDRPLSIAFWSINIGLAAMVLLSTLPIGLAQAWASVEIRNMVCAFIGISAHAHVDPSALDANVRRHHLCIRGARAGLVCTGTCDWPFL